MNAKYMAVGEGNAGLERDYGTIMSHLDQFAQDTKFLESIRPELRNKYPNCWVAVYKKEIVDVGPSLRQVMKNLAQKDILGSRAVIDYLRKDPIALIL